MKTFRRTRLEGAVLPAPALTLALALALALALTLTAGVRAQAGETVPKTTPPQTASTQTPAGAASGNARQTTPVAQSTPAPGSPVGGDAPLPAQPAHPQTTSASQNASPCPANTNTSTTKNTRTTKKKNNDKEKNEKKLDEAEPGTTPVGGDCAAKVDPDKVIEPGSDLIHVKHGSIEDVNAVGNRKIGGRGLGNWYSTNGEIAMGRQYAEEIDKSSRFIADPVVDEYVNRIGQDIVKNSDCKVPFTIKVIDSDEINAMALPGGFFYVNSGLILAADEEAELAGVMAHEVAHVCAHHAAREMTRMHWTQIGMVPMMIMLPYDWAGLGVYEGTQLAVPVAFLQFSRDFEAQADYLGVQYMYRAGYDPQAFIAFFEKIQALQKRKPGMVSRAFSDHPQTPDRILRSQREIARILPARSDYLVTTSEFDDVKARLARIENKRRLNDKKRVNRPLLRRASTNGEDAGNAADGPAG